jgi:hypothetical protein
LPDGVRFIVRNAMPDGRIIGVLVGSDGSFNQITVVLNWFEELKQRVPSK